ncbi:MAG TPA: polysaccharide biosynthesis/export family protein [Chitinophagaceae bacterium]|nr:polysaccharide biosynthesis/export family protein [Chitinophagaceae bacterium]
MKSITGFSLLVIMTGLISSCGTQFKLPNYLENIRDSSRLDTFSFPEPIIQKNDILYINVTSDDNDPKTIAPYNTSVSAGGMMTNNSTLMGYLVDHKGEIEYPRIGTIRTEGLTKAQLAAIIKERLTKYLQNPVVNIRFLTFKVIVLGEVGGQGSISVPGERLTILEAIGLAGGITWNGRRENVKIIRETNGVRQLGIIDLTSEDIFKSPYYNLQQNDIVMVDLNRRGRVTQDQQYTMSRISFAVGIITTAAVLISIFK